MDHMRRKTLKLEHVHTVVLDEADEMLNMGFLEDMETILSELPGRTPDCDVLRHNASRYRRDCRRKFQKDPEIVKVVKKELTVPKVTQYYYEVKPKTKVEVMCRLLDMYPAEALHRFLQYKKTGG